MQEIVTADHFGLGIGQEGVGKTQLLAMLFGGLRRIDADRNYTNAPRIKVRKPLLETPQLGVAE